MQPSVESTKKVKVGQRVRAGGVLMRSEPFVAVLDDHFKGVHCHHCFNKSPSSMSCPGCKCECYCSATCRSAAWSLHQHECPFLPPLTLGGYDWMQRMLLKLVIKLKTGGDQEWVAVDNQLSRQFRHITRHTEKYRADQDHYNRFQRIKTTMTQHLPRGFLPDDDTLLDMYSALAVNVFFISNNREDTIGAALYLGAGVYSSSCRPTATWSYEGSSIIIRSLVDIPSYRRDMVFLSFCQPLEPFAQRQSTLRKHLCFDCKCERCTDDFGTAIEGAICCGNPACPYPVEVPDRLLNPPPLGLECELTPEGEAQTLSCPRCGYSDYPASVLDDYKGLLGHCKDTTQKIIEGDFSYECDDLLTFAWHQLLRLQQRAKKGHSQIILHPLNIHLVQLLNEATDLAIETCHLEKAITFLEMNIKGMQHYCGHNGQELGLTYFKMGKICIYLKRFKPALRYFREADKILKISHGVNHSLLVDELYPLMDATKDVKTVRKNPMSLRHFKNCAKKAALQQKKTHNWLYWSFGGLLLTMVCLGVSGVNASAVL